MRVPCAPPPLLLLAALACLPTITYVVADEVAASMMVPAGDSPAGNLSAACFVCPPGSCADKENKTRPCALEDPDGHCAGPDFVGACPYPPPGYKGPGFVWEGKRTLCTKCSNTTFSDIWGAESCKICPEGEMPDKPRTGCEKCPAGHTTDDKNRTCHMCPPGQQPSPTTCASCEAGHYSNHNQTSGGICKPCTLGLVSNKDKTDCEMCPVGLSADDKHANCVVCKLGEVWSPTTGCVKSCGLGMKCTWNTVPSVPSSSYCSSCGLCSLGWFNDGSGQGEQKFECLPCPKGTFQDKFGGVTCKPCAPGYYQTTIASSKCDECPAGFYCEHTDQPPVPCPPQRYCPRGAQRPQECSAWYKPDTTGCKPTLELIVIIASCSVGAAALLAALVYFNYRKYSSHLPSDREALISQQQTKEPVYTGL